MGWEPWVSVGNALLTLVNVLVIRRAWRVLHPEKSLGRGGWQAQQPDEFGLYDCPRCHDAVVNLREHLEWCEQSRLPRKSRRYG